MSSQKPLVVVIGATGAQGGSVVEALLKDGGYTVRGVTRDTNNDKSKKLEARGVQMVAADVTNSATLQKAFEGAWAVFAVTNFWDPSQMGKEVEIGSTMADAAKAAGVQYYVWSSLEDVHAKSNGKYHVPHFTDKHKVNEHINKIGLKGIFVAAAFYFQNFGGFFPPKKDEQGNIVFALPYAESGYITAYDVNDTGAAVVGALKNPDKFVGKFIPLWGKHAQLSEYLKEFTEVTGKPTKFTQLPSNAYGPEMEQMFGWFQEFHYYGPNADYNLQSQVNPNPTSWKQWLKESGWGASL